MRNASSFSLNLNILAFLLLLSLFTTIIQLILVDESATTIKTKNVTIAPSKTQEKFNFNKIKYIYHLGFDGPYGRTNNQLTAILHAIDQIFDKNQNKEAIIAMHNRWGYPVLKGLFCGDNETDFKIRLESLHHPFIIHESRIKTFSWQ